jgi:hypothetical protein
VEDTLLGRSRGRPEENQRRQQRQPEPPHQPARPKLTFGAVWMLASTSS